MLADFNLFDGKGGNSIDVNIQQSLSHRSAISAGDFETVARGRRHAFPVADVKWGVHFILRSTLIARALGISRTTGVAPIHSMRQIN